MVCVCRNLRLSPILEKPTVPAPEPGGPSEGPYDIWETTEGPTTQDYRSLWAPVRPAYGRWQTGIELPHTRGESSP